MWRPSQGDHLRSRASPKPAAPTAPATSHCRRATLPLGYTLADAEELVLEIEEVLEVVAEELNLEGYLVVHGRQWGDLQGWLDADADISPRQARRAVLDALPQQAGVEYFSGDSRGGDERDRYVHEISIRGDDPEVVSETRDLIAERVRHVEGVAGVRRSGEPRPNEIGLEIDRDRAQRQGVSPRVVAGVVAYARSGQPLPRYDDDGRQVPVRIRFREQDRESLDQLFDFAVPTATGEFVQLAALTRAGFASAPRDIVRIVLIDYVGRLRREGLARAEAILLAAKRRFRPIMMTAGTTIGGMIPLTLGAPTNIGLSYRSFGITLIGGMITATLLTLLVVPVFYTLFDDARSALRRLVHVARRSHGSSSRAP